MRQEEVEEEEGGYCTGEGGGEKSFRQIIRKSLDR
jgi:hypothetical protein